MLVFRKLGHVLQGLKLLEDQGTVEGFFSNVENADKLAGLVEDVRDAVMDYQVCDQNNVIFPCLIPISDSIATRHLLQEQPTYCELHLFIAGLMW